MRRPRSRLPRSKLLVATAGLAALAGVVAAPQLLHGRVASALSSLAGADPRLLWLAGLGFAAGFVCTVGAWHTAFAAAGGRISPRQVGARLGIGSLVNSVAPAKVGDAVKIALCSKAIDGQGRIWTA